MADVKMASFGMPSVGRNEKPVVVRMKRKASQASLDAFWLEINERPLKRPLLDFEKLSLSDHESKVSEALKKKRLLVQHVETVSPSEAIEDVLQSLLLNSSGSKDFIKIEARKGYFKQDKKHDQLRSVARQEREELVRNARFEQIWKSRRGEIDSLRELCHLYDVVRVDAEDEKPMKKSWRNISVEDNASLCNYLPLLREYIPSAAEEIEFEIKAYVSGEGSSGSDSIAKVPREDGYVYDLYTVEEDFTGNDEDISCDFPLVQVKNENDSDDMIDSEYDSEDSNAEDHPRNEYPDEDSSDEEDEDLDPFGDFEYPNSDYDEEMVINNKKDDQESSEGDKYVHIFSDSDCSD